MTIILYRSEWKYSKSLKDNILDNIGGFLFAINGIWNWFPSEVWTTIVSSNEHNESGANFTLNKAFKPGAIRESMLGYCP